MLVGICNQFKTSLSIVWSWRFQGNNIQASTDQHFTISFTYRICFKKHTFFYTFTTRDHEWSGHYMDNHTWLASVVYNIEQLWLATCSSTRTQPNYWPLTCGTLQLHDDMEAAKAWCHVCTKATKQILIICLENTQYMKQWLWEGRNVLWLWLISTGTIISSIFPWWTKERKEGGQAFISSAFLDITQSTFKIHTY